MESLQKSKIKYIACFLLLITLAVVPVTGCMSNNKIPDQVTVQLKWLHQAQFAGLYVAEKEGFY